MANLKSCAHCYGLYELEEAPFEKLIKEAKNRYQGVIWTVISQMLDLGENTRPKFDDLRNFINNTKIPPYAINIVLRITDSDDIQKLNNPNYLPQDFVNEIEGKVSRLVKKSQDNMEEMYFMNGNKYIGERNSKGEQHGVGTFWFANGDRYEGLWKNGEYQGEGLYFASNGMKHYGYFNKGEIEGLGVRYYVEKGLYFG